MKPARAIRQDETAMPRHELASAGGLACWAFALDPSPRSATVFSMLFVVAYGVRRMIWTDGDFFADYCLAYESREQDAIFAFGGTLHDERRQERVRERRERGSERRRRRAYAMATAAALGGLGAAWALRGGGLAWAQAAFVGALAAIALAPGPRELGRPLWISAGAMAAAFAFEARIQPFAGVAWTFALGASLALRTQILPDWLDAVAGGSPASARRTPHSVRAGFGVAALLLAALAAAEALIPKGGGKPPGFERAAFGEAATRALARSAAWAESMTGDGAFDPGASPSVPGQARSLAQGGGGERPELPGVSLGEAATGQGALTLGEAAGKAAGVGTGSGGEGSLQALASERAHLDQQGDLQRLSDLPALSGEAGLKIERGQAPTKEEIEAAIRTLRERRPEAAAKDLAKALEAELAKQAELAKSKASVGEGERSARPGHEASQGTPAGGSRNDAGRGERGKTGAPAAARERLPESASVEREGRIKQLEFKWRPKVEGLIAGAKAILIVGAALAAFRLLFGAARRPDPHSAKTVQILPEARRKIKAELKRLRTMKLPPEQEIIETYHALLRVLESVDLKRDEHVPPAEFAARLQRDAPALGAPVAKLTAAFSDVLYGSLEATAERVQASRDSVKATLRILQVG